MLEKQIWNHKFPLSESQILDNIVAFLALKVKPKVSLKFLTIDEYN